MKDWFQVEALDDTTYVISEYEHYEKTNCYLLLGKQRVLLIDSGLGVVDIHEITDQLTTLPVTVIVTHVHWNHIDSHGSYTDVLVHKREYSWLDGKFPLPLGVVRQQLMKEPCFFPGDFHMSAHTVWQGHVGIVGDGDILNLGGRHIRVLHIPGHSPGHMCLFDLERERLYCGDLIYKGILYCDYPSTDPQAYLLSVQRLQTLALQRLLPVHYIIEMGPSLIQEAAQAWEELQEKGLLQHSNGEFRYENFSIRLQEKKEHENIDATGLVLYIQALGTGSFLSERMRFAIYGASA